MITDAPIMAAPDAINIDPVADTAATQIIETLSNDIAQIQAVANSFIEINEVKVRLVTSREELMHSLPLSVHPKGTIHGLVGGTESVSKAIPGGKTEQPRKGPLTNFNH